MADIRPERIICHVDGTETVVEGRDMTDEQVEEFWARIAAMARAAEEVRRD